MSKSRSNYDVIIVGAGIAGCTLAHGLSTLPRATPLRIVVVKRSLAEPDRIIGDLLQPGGVIEHGHLTLPRATALPLRSVSRTPAPAAGNPETENHFVGAVVQRRKATDTAPSRS